MGVQMNERNWASYASNSTKERERNCMIAAYRDNLLHPLEE